MNAKKLVKMEEVVKPILEADPMARDDDFRLYFRVIEQLCPEDVSRIPLARALNGRKAIGLPNYESVTRVRRKLQRQYPELESKRMRKRRLKECEGYKEYAAM